MGLTARVRLLGCKQYGLSSVIQWLAVELDLVTQVAELWDRPGGPVPGLDQSSIALILCVDVVSPCWQGLETFCVLETTSMPIACLLALPSRLYYTSDFVF